MDAEIRLIAFRPGIRTGKRDFFSGVDCALVGVDELGPDLERSGDVRYEVSEKSVVSTRTRSSSDPRPKSTKARGSDPCPERAGCEDDSAGAECVPDGEATNITGSAVEWLELLGVTAGRGAAATCACLRRGDFADACVHVDADGVIMPRRAPRDTTLLIEWLARNVSLASGGRLLYAETRAVELELTAGSTMDDEVAGIDSSRDIASLSITLAPSSAITDILDWPPEEHAENTSELVAGTSLATESKAAGASSMGELETGSP